MLKVQALSVLRVRARRTGRPSGQRSRMPLAAPWWATLVGAWVGGDPARARTVVRQNPVVFIGDKLSADWSVGKSRPIRDHYRPNTK